MKVPAAQYIPPMPVLVVAGAAIIVLLMLVARTLTDFLIALLQLGVILAALLATVWVGNILLRRVRP